MATRGEYRHMVSHRSSRQPDETLLTTLRDRRVVEFSGDDTIHLTSTFLDRVSRHEQAISRLSSTELEALLRSVTVPGSDVESLRRTVADEEAILAEYMALSELDELSDEGLYRSLAVMDALRGSHQTSDLAPNSLAPVRAHRLPLLVEAYTRAIVYVWMEDCDPCEAVSNQLDDIDGDIPDEVAQLSVYGPADAEFLNREYRVEGAPTLLFFLGGEVDVRLKGPTEKFVIENEVKKLLDLKP